MQSLEVENIIKDAMISIIIETLAIKERGFKEIEQSLAGLISRNTQKIFASTTVYIQENSYKKSTLSQK